jgi:hypothetical protein
MDASEVQCEEKVLDFETIERLMMGNEKDYPVVSRNGRQVQMMNAINSLEGAVELWMANFQTFRTPRSTSQRFY